MLDFVSLSETPPPSGAFPVPPAGDAAAAIRRFLEGLAPGTVVPELTRETALLGSGLLDSLGILQLTMFLAEEFGIDIGDDDFTLENFASVGALLDFIAARRTG
jgi:acyl carrier protein